MESLERRFILELGKKIIRMYHRDATLEVSYDESVKFIDKYIRSGLWNNGCPNIGINSEDIELRDYLLSQKVFISTCEPDLQERGIFNEEYERLISEKGSSMNPCAKCWFGHYFMAIEILKNKGYWRV